MGGVTAVFAFKQGPGKSIVNTVYEQLYTPYGLRSLSNRDKAYKKEYIGKLLKRDLAYHMGTAWGFYQEAL